MQSNDEGASTAAGMAISASALALSKTRSKKWTEQEEALVVAAVTAQLQQGSTCINWTDVAKQLPHAERTGKQCREKWKNDLSPDLCKEPWTLREEYILARMHSEVGNRWAKITKFLPGRSENGTKKHCATCTEEHPHRSQPAAAAASACGQESSQLAARRDSLLASPAAAAWSRMRVPPEEASISGEGAAPWTRAAARPACGHAGNTGAFARGVMPTVEDVLRARHQHMRVIMAAAAQGHKHLMPMQYNSHANMGSLSPSGRLQPPAHPFQSQAHPFQHTHTAMQAAGRAAGSPPPALELVSEAQRSAYPGWPPTAMLSTWHPLVGSPNQPPASLRGQPFFPGYGIPMQAHGHTTHPPLGRPVACISAHTSSASAAEEEEEGAISLLLLGQSAAAVEAARRRHQAVGEQGDGVELASRIGAAEHQPHLIASQEEEENFVTATTPTAVIDKAPASTAAPTSSQPADAVTAAAAAAATTLVSQPTLTGALQSAEGVAQPPTGACTTEGVAQQPLTGASTAEDVTAVSLSDCVALETLLRRAATLTGVSDALRTVTVWLDSWDGRMHELRKTLAVDVFGGRWRRNLQGAVEAWDGEACTGLLQMIDLLPE